MPTLTLKNIPKELYAMLEASAKRNRRSPNSESLARLERELAAPTIDARVCAKELEAFTARLPKVEHRRVGRYKHHGRARLSLTAMSSPMAGNGPFTALAQSVPVIGPA